jgi:hypothetical protein
MVGPYLTPGRRRRKVYCELMRRDDRETIYIRENNMCDFDYSMTHEILEAFTEKISARDGKVTETFHQPGLLFARSVLPQTEEIRVGDQLQGGVALRATDTAAWVYPYVFRLVCKNGAIMTRAAEGREIPNLDSVPVFEAVTLVREAVESCCDRNAFATAAGQMRTAAQQPIDASLSRMPFLSRVSSLNPEFARQIFERFFHGKDRTRYGFMNAVTSVARDTRDHAARWRLEELGGQIAVMQPAEPVLDDGAEELIPRDDESLVISR